MTDPQVIVNLGTGGSDLNGQNGSTASADSNDARFLDWPGDNAGNYVYLPGVTGNFLSVPDEAALDINGDIDIRLRVALDDWTPSVVNRLVTKFSSAAGNYSYQFSIGTSGLLRLSWSANGTAVISKDATAATGLADGSVKWVRATLDVDNGASGNDVKFFLSDDGIAWTQLGATVTTATATSIYSGNANLKVGAFQDAGVEPVVGKVYRAVVKNGIDGTTVLDIDTSVITSGSVTSFTALTGQTVTIARSTSSRKSVAVVSPVWLMGTDDYFRVLDNALLDFGSSDDFTIVAAFRAWDTNGGVRISKTGTLTTTPGYEARFRRGSGSLIAYASDGVSFNQESDTLTGEGQVKTVAMIVDRTAQTISIWNDGTFAASPASIAGYGSFANVDNLNVGRTLSTYSDVELVSATTYRRKLSETELDQIKSYYQSRWS
jgi:hypothetical protein